MLKSGAFRNTFIQAGRHQSRVRVRRLDMIRISTRLAAVSLAILMVLAAFFVQRSLAQAPAADVIALTGARVIDGTGKAPLGQATLVIRHGRIEAGGAPARENAPHPESRG